MMKKVRRLSYIYTLLVVLLTACTGRVIYYKYQPVPQTVWSSDKPILFNIDSVRHEGDYKFQLSIRTGSSFPFQALWIVVEQHWTNPTTTRLDTIICPISDDRGNFTGQGISVYQQNYDIGTYTISKGSKAKIKISHIMRREQLPGVTDVGLQMVRVD